MMKTTSSNELICGSVVLDRHVLNHVGNVFASVGGGFEQFVDFFLADELDGVLFIPEELRQKIALHFVHLIFQAVDLDTDIYDGLLAVQGAQSIHQKRAAAVHLLSQLKNSGRDGLQAIGDDPKGDVVNAIEDVVEGCGERLDVFGIERGDEVDRRRLKMSWTT